MKDTEVLIAGAGPVGLTAAIELARRGVACRVVDPLPEPPQYAKAVGVQPRTLEIFETMGILREVLNAGTEMRGQIVHVNGEKVTQLDLTLPGDIPFAFLCIPQYATERILAEEARRRGVEVRRGVRLTAFTQDADGVSATLAGPDGEITLRGAYLVGADGAHSVVRKGLGLTFEGAAFDEQYMLGDVEVDWSQPPGYAIRAMHQTDGTTDDLLVCIPLPGRNRYRISMLVPDELAAAPADGVAHGFEGGRRPELGHLQAVLDRLAPEPTTARNLRWSSVFRISHRIVDAYGRGRVFVAGDAAHIHPPTGAQGMNTGIQDAHNLAWKLALAVGGHAAAGLLDSYDAERRPVGEEVVGRTVRSAREGIGADAHDPNHMVLREAQLLIDYADSPLVAAAGGVTSSAVGAGRRAPDAARLRRAVVAGPVRLFSLFGADHTLLCYADGNAGGAEVAAFEAAADAAVRAAHGRLDAYLVAAPTADVETTVLPLLRDEDGDFARSYSTAGTSMFVVRPDGYLGYACHGIDTAALLSHLGNTFA
ncbi:FAD-dependent monooxygenase [Mycobacterium sp. NPDC050041]|uniref:FAD-dependent monooxygenase n=1 Tax=Mycobacterium sp. NPDC050041 TaxID=3364293 RepID=UPI003C2FF64C